MAKKHDTVKLESSIIDVMEQYRRKAFSRIAKSTTLKDISGKSLCDIAKYFFDAGYWIGMLDTINNPDLKESATEISKRIKEQEK